MTADVTSENTAMKYQAWGWNVIIIKGNDQHEIRYALKKANEEKSRPTLIIGKTIMGKGAVAETGESFERKSFDSRHAAFRSRRILCEDHYHLGGDPANPFVIFPEVAEYYQQVRREKIGNAKRAKEQAKTWKKANPESAKKLTVIYCWKNTGDGLARDPAQGRQRDPGRIRNRTCRICKEDREHDRLFR